MLVCPSEPNAGLFMEYLHEKSHRTHMYVQISVSAQLCYTINKTLATSLRHELHTHIQTHTQAHTLTKIEINIAQNQKSRYFM